MKYLEAKEGDILTFDIISWDDGWEFGRPVVMLRPVLKIRDDDGHEYLLENVLIDLVCGDQFPVEGSDCDKHEFHWRGWNLKTLKRRFAESLKGKHFPVRNYRATRTKVEIIKDDNDELYWRVL